MDFCKAINAKHTALFFFFLSSFSLKSQVSAEQVSTHTITFGHSAISVNSIVATTLRFEYPIKDCVYDSTSAICFVSGKQQGDLTDQVMVKGFFAAIDRQNAVKWILESSLYDLELAAGQLLVSNEERSVKYNKWAAYDELRFPGKVLATFNKSTLALLYARGNTNDLMCFDLNTGLQKWTASIPGGQDWVDVQQLNDSILIVAASGIHALHLQKGLLWSLPMPTAQYTEKSLTHSNANVSTIQKLSKVLHTAFEENLVTQIASNILVNGETILFASKEKCVALNAQGQVLWSMELKNYPVSKMVLFRSQSGVVLYNLGLAMHSDRYVSWGKPFLLELSLQNGTVGQEHDLKDVENMADFFRDEHTLVVAGKHELLTVSFGTPELKSVLPLQHTGTGKFVAFINGNEHYIFKEGYFVPLNFINGNLHYFKTDNNKIYGIQGDTIEYEYHFTELYRLLGKFDGKLLLTNSRVTLLVSQNYEVMFQLDTAAPPVITDNKLYFIEENRLVIVDKDQLR